jgi:hypothetical protein
MHRTFYVLTKQFVNKNIFFVDCVEMTKECSVKSYFKAPKIVFFTLSLQNVFFS